MIRNNINLIKNGALKNLYSFIESLKRYHGVKFIGKFGHLCTYFIAKGALNIIRYHKCDNVNNNKIFIKETKIVPKYKKHILIENSFIKLQIYFSSTRQKMI